MSMNYDQSIAVYNQGWLRQSNVLVQRDLSTATTQSLVTNTLKNLSQGDVKSTEALGLLNNIIAGASGTNNNIDSARNGGRHDRLGVGNDSGALWWDDGLYRRMNGDVDAAIKSGNSGLVNGLHHWGLYGYNESRRGDEGFDAIAYADGFPDIKAAFGYDVNALKNHFVYWGVQEGRVMDEAPDYAKSNYITAGSGNDVIDAQAHNDVVDAGSGNDNAKGGSGNDVLSGGAGNDVLDGGTGNDVIDGGTGNDVIIAGKGNNVIAGGAGNDTFCFKSDGSEAGALTYVTDFAAGDSVVINGNATTHTLQQTAEGVEMQISRNGELDQTVVFLGKTIDQVRDSIENSVEVGFTDNMTPTDGDDILIGTPETNSIDGMAGNDRIIGLGSDDILMGGAGNDEIDGDGIDPRNPQVHPNPGASGADTINGGDGDDIIRGQAGNDVLFGDAGNDTLTGGEGNDQVWGQAGQDSLTGGAGDDIFGFNPLALPADEVAESTIKDFTTGEDSILIDDNGNADDVTYTLTEAGNDVRVDLFDNTGDTPILKQRVIVEGVALDDVQDQITGGTEDDNAGNGNTNGATDGDDTLIGTEGPDTIDGLGGNDTIIGLGGDDTLIGGPGNDIIDAGEGNDNVTGNDGDDILFGGPGNDDLDGGAGNDFVLGMAGDDDLIGGTGNDFLYGGLDNDAIIGGEGNDMFIFGAEALNGEGLQSTAEVLDFDSGDTIRIVDSQNSGLTDVQAGYTLEQDGNDVIMEIFQARSSTDADFDDVNESITFRNTDVDSVRGATNGGLFFDLQQTTNGQADTVEFGGDEFPLIDGVPTGANDVVRGYNESEGDVIEIQRGQQFTNSNGELDDRLVGVVPTAAVTDPGNVGDNLLVSMTYTTVDGDVTEYGLIAKNEFTQTPDDVTLTISPT